MCRVQVFDVDNVLVEQVAEARALTFRPFGDEGAGVRLDKLPIALGSDYKMVLIQQALAGAACTWRSPTFNVPMSMFDLVVRDPALRRDGASIVAVIQLARAEERKRCQQQFSAEEQTQHSRERTALFGGLAAKTLTDLDAAEPPRLPLGGTTAAQLQVQPPDLRAAHEAFGAAAIPARFTGGP